MLYHVVDQTKLPLNLTLKQFQTLVYPVSARKVWQMISTGKFPQPTSRIGNKTSIWKTEELLDWVAEQEQRERNRRPINVHERTRKKIKAMS